MTTTKFVIEANFSDAVFGSFNIQKFQKVPKVFPLAKLEITLF
jgi:hypothetical protein